MRLLLFSFVLATSAHSAVLEPLDKLCGKFDLFGSSNGVVIPIYTNAQKLSLPANTAVGTKVKVSDGFVVSGVGDGQDGFWYPVGTLNGKPEYRLVGAPPNDYQINWQGGQWNFVYTGAFSTEDVAYPWLTTIWNVGTPAFTHPAVQQLASPSSALTAVFISGAGTSEVNGIYTDRGTYNGKRYYNLLGAVDDPDTSSIRWDPTAAQWYLKDSGSTIIYSGNSTAFPYQVTTWLNADTDPDFNANGAAPSPAASSITNGQIAAGIKFGSDFYAITTPINGRNAYHDVLGIAPNFTWNGTIWTDGTHNGVGTPAFPWSVTGITITQDDVCSEENWDNVP